jgi:hypothetical protein
MPARRSRPGIAEHYRSLVGEVQGNCSASSALPSRDPHAIFWFLPGDPVAAGLPIAPRA